MHFIQPSHYLVSVVLVALVLFTPAAVASTNISGIITCPNSCSSIGACNTYGVCQCPPGSLGVDCSVQSTTSIPVYDYAFTGLGGQNIRQTWRVDTTLTEPQLELRWCQDTGSWFGGIFDVNYDGMTPATGTTGDTWTTWTQVTSTTPQGTTYIGDWTSTGRSAPIADTQQDLKLINSWIDGNFDCVEFTRLLNTGDSKDLIISSTPGQSLRFMWTYGLSNSGGSGSGGSRKGSTSSSMPQLTMHGYLAKTGQYRVDFAGGIMVPLNDGIEWPRGYLYALILTACALVLPFGLITQRDYIKRSTFGRCLRRRPFSGWCGGKRSREEGCLHTCTGQALPIFRLMSLQELTIWLIYIGINVAVAVTSFSQYDDNGRGRAYILGHLLSIHLALAILPVARNSVFLSVFNIGYDLAVQWHRRIGRITFIYFLLHLVSMFVIWDVSVVVSLVVVSWGYGPLFGTLSFLCMIALLIFSLERIRRTRWELFKYSHIILVICIYIFGMLHSVNLRYLLIVPGGLYLVDVLARWFWRPLIVNGGKAETEPLHVLDHHKTPRLVKVEAYGQADDLAFHNHVIILHVLLVSHKSKKSEFPTPGSHYNLVIPEIHYLESHPYTVSSVRVVERSDLVNMYLTFHILVVNSGNQSWTMELYERVVSVLQKGKTQAVFGGWDGGGGDEDRAVAGSESSSSLLVLKAEIPVKLTPFGLLLDGPYYSLNLPILSSRILVLIGGGIGVTPLTSIISWYVDEYDRRQSAKAESNVAPLPEQIHLIWTARNASAFLHWFPTLLTRIRDQHAPRIRVQLYLTTTQDVNRVVLQRAIARSNSHSPDPNVRTHHITVVNTHDTAVPVVESVIEMGGVSRPDQVVESEPEAAQELGGTTPSAAGNSSPPPASAFPITHGRPVFGVFFDSLARELNSIQNTPGVIRSLADVTVLSCGPEAMVDEAEYEAEQAGCSFTHEAFAY